MKVWTDSSSAPKRLALIAGVILCVVALYSSPADGAGIAPAASTGTVFGGFTSQHEPSFFRVSKNENVLVAGSAALQLKCTSGARPVFEDDFSHLRIAASGRLQGNWALPATKQSDGSTVAAGGVMVAHLDRRAQKLYGTWQLHAMFVSASGQTDTCDSGVVRFTDVQ